MASLFARDIIVATLASGSKGNCTYIGDGHAGVLVDCGLSATQILKRMAEVDLANAPIDGVLITHEHADHVGAARVLSRRLRERNGQSVPFYMTRGTDADLHPASRPDGIEHVRGGRPFPLRHFTIDPFDVPHDTLEPVAYRVGIGGTWVGVVTDLGRSTSLVESKLSTLSIAVLEFNHDVELLMGGTYPWPLKQRIRSSHGHLSNEQSADLLKRGLGKSLEHVILAHLSEENNRPAKALAAADNALGVVGARGAVKVHVATQAQPMAPLRTRAPTW